MKYLVTGPVNVDRIFPLENGEYQTPHVEIGGGGIYALSGIKLWTDDCMPVAYAGTDYPAYYSKWFSDNSILPDGMTAIFDETVATRLYYQPDGRYTIEWAPGDLGTGRNTANIQLLEPFLQPAVHGIHLVAHGNAVFFSQLDRYRKSCGIRVGYEINNENEFYVNAPEFIETVTSRYLDFFSLSYGEMKEYFPDTRDVRDALERCMSWGCPVYLRAGTEGGYMIADGTCCHIPMVSAFGNTDPTGCGNTSTAAVFWALSEGYSPKRAGIIGAVTASLNAGYNGLIERITPSLRNRCMELVMEMENQNFVREVKLS